MASPAMCMRDKGNSLQPWVDKSTTCNTREVVRPYFATSYWLRRLAPIYVQYVALKAKKWGNLIS